MIVKHGYRKRGVKRTKEYYAWSHMISRCNNPNHHAYKNYGGRGIRVCDRWLEFENFLSDMGVAPSPNLTLDRFPNNDGNYEPGNCRWATPAQQSVNRRVCKYYTYGDQTKTIKEWSAISGINLSTLKSRIEIGWPFEKAISTPTNHPR